MLKIAIELKKSLMLKIPAQADQLLQGILSRSKKREVSISQIGHLTVVHPISLFVAGTTWFEIVVAMLFQVCVFWFSWKLEQVGLVLNT